MTYLHDPEAVLDYVFDWQPWLANAETIVSATVEATPGIDVAPDGRPTDVSDSAVTVWLAGGTEGVTYDITCRISTTAGRTDDRTIRVRSLHR